MLDNAAEPIRVGFELEVIFTSTKYPELEGLEEGNVRGKLLEAKVAVT